MDPFLWDVALELIHSFVGTFQIQRYCGEVLVIIFLTMENGRGFMNLFFILLLRLVFILLFVTSLFAFLVVVWT